MINNIYNNDLVQNAILKVKDANNEEYIVRREEYDNVKYYFRFRNPSNSKILPKAKNLHNTIICDYVHRSNHSNGSNLECLSGFTIYDQFYRMRKDNQNYSVSPCEQMSNAGIHASEILNIIQNEFDSVSEGLNSVEEFTMALECDRIRQLNVDGELASFYWAQPEMNLSHLRYIYVAEKFRGTGLGKNALRDFVHQAAHDARNCILWVSKSNQVAINLYEELGFYADGLVNTIWLYEEKNV